MSAPSRFKKKGRGATPRSRRPSRDERDDIFAMSGGYTPAELEPDEVDDPAEEEEVDREPTDSVMTPAVAALEAATPVTAVPHPDTESLLEWDSIRPELESKYRMKLDDDDPMRMLAEVVRIVLMRSQSAAAVALRSQVEREMESFRKELDAAMKARQAEGHTNILKMLTVAQGQLKQSAVEANAGLKDGAQELIAAGKALRQTNRLIRPYDWFIGAVFLSVMVIAGIIGGYVYATVGK